ncbi:hypothetical protein E2P81_ATG01704 [Venturia nashicola]|uniref:Uncharacterized protein n=1 Tax=Venturia nashicola TaxID=86259 RepID=A0A4Z1NGX5_9PEZI|nr:hypothetical protein E6O75_ATG01747 [Venturia nashicola]TLD18976.1 hypothetical protein E2P81_ATG01704 [Venturia nashicola]
MARSPVGQSPPAQSNSEPIELSMIASSAVANPVNLQSSQTHPLEERRWTTALRKASPTHRQQWQTQWWF